MIKLKIKIQSILLFGIIAVGQVSCISLNSHQTGRTVGKDNSSTLVSFNYGSNSINGEQYRAIDGLFYIAEIGVFHGIKENLDIGMKVNSSFHFTGGSKFQFIGNKKSFFASSVGLDLGAAPIGPLFGILSYSSSLSLYNSFHPTDYLAFTISPRYSYFGFGSFLKPGFKERNNIYGYSAGLIVGKKHQFSFELSQYVNNTRFRLDTKPIISLGYILNFKY